MNAGKCWIRIDRFRITWREDNLCSQDDMLKFHILNIIFYMERETEYTKLIMIKGSIIKSLFDIIK